MANKKEGKIGLEFYCFFCNVKCRDNYNLKKHIETDKHKRLTLTNKKEGFNFSCECGKNYKHSPSLSKHKKTCSIYLLNICNICNNDNIYDTSNDIINSNNNDNDNIIDNNNELLNLVKEQNKKIEKLEQTIKHNTNNNQNK